MYIKNFMQLGDNMRYFLDQRGITQQSLAETLGVSEQVVNKMIKGNKAINLKEIVKIAQAMGVSMDDLLETREKDISVIYHLRFMENVHDEDTLQKVKQIRNAIDEIHMLEEVLNDK